MEELIEKLGDSFTAIERQKDVQSLPDEKGEVHIFPVVFRVHGFKQNTDEVHKYRQGIGLTPKEALENFEKALSKIEENLNKE